MVLNLKHNFFKYLKTRDTLIIYEIPITSTLFYFISDMFSVIQQQINAFGGLNVIVVGDLAHQYNFNGFFYFVKWYNAKIGI